MPALDASERLAALHATGLLDSPAEPLFDDIIALVARTLNVPVALLSLVDDRRQFFKSAQGLAEPWATLRQTPLTHSFCQYAVAQGGTLVVTNAPDDPRVKDNLAIPDLGVIAYAGVPVEVDSQPIGVLCAIDGKPRTWTDDELSLLRVLASVTQAEVARRATMSRLVAVTEDLRAQHALMRAVFESMEDAVLVVDRDAHPVFANHATEKLFGPAISDATQRSPLADELPIARALRGDTVRGWEVQVRDRWRSVNASPLRGPDGELLGALSVGRDITELRDAQQQLQEAAVRDELTGLYNRRGFIEHAARAVAIADRTGRALALFYLDLNGMKAINDSLGHAMGDAALIETAQILGKTFRATDVIARLGGDEFVVLAADYEASEGEAVSGRLRKTMHDRNDDPRQRYRLSASVGVTIYDPTARKRSLDELLSEADGHMYTAKVERKRRGG